MDPDTTYPVIDLMEEQKNITDKGGTMRLGGYRCIVAQDTKTFRAYGTREVIERHRHRYELNNKYLDDLRQSGMVPAGINPEMNLVEIIELPSHRWFVGVQFHPEYNSTVQKPHPLFAGFIKACMEYGSQKKDNI